MIQGPQFAVDALAKVEMLEGWCSLEKAHRLAELVREMPAEATYSVELGVFGGRGTYALGVGHWLSDRQDGLAIGVDPYTAAADQQGDHDQAHKDWWAKMDYEAIYRHTVGALRVMLPRWQTIYRTSSLSGIAETFLPGSIGVLHQDSNHSAEVSCREIDHWLPKLHPAGAWVMDDANWATVQPAIAKMTSLGWAIAEDHQGEAFRWLVWRKVGA